MIIRAMSGDSLFRAFDRFKLTETGRRIIEGKKRTLGNPAKSRETESKQAGQLRPLATFRSCNQRKLLLTAW